MSFWGKICFTVCIASLLIAAGGCSPSDPSSTDEEKEFHFQQGNNCFNSMDYPGAVDEFRQALEVNPRSAQAHYRLAQLFDSKQPDPAAAIFHYEEYLRLDRQAENTNVIQERIAACKEQLAEGVLTLPTAPAAVHQIYILTQTNEALKLQIAQLQADKKSLNDYIATLQAAPKPAPNIPSTPGNPGWSQGGVTPLPGDNHPPNPPAAYHSRTYIVKASETMSAIARKNSVSLAALESANPGVNPKKLRVGQTLNLP